MITTPSRRLAAAALLAAVAAAGCSGPGDAPAAGSPAPSAAPSAPPATGAPADGREADAVRLPWPDGAASLQRAVDDGAQPWLLDPAEVATSFATAVLGWTGATATSRSAAAVDLTSTDGERATVFLRQPGRVGPGGIWVVTGVERP